MKKSVAASVVVIVALVIIGGVFFWQYRSRILNQNVTPPPATPAAALSFQDQTVTDNTAPFQISVTYPTVAGMDGFNTEVKTAVDNAIAQFKSDATANGQLMQKNDPADYAKYPPQYSLNMGYTKGELDENIISVMFEEDEFTGGAHDINTFLPINYNVTTGKEIALADVFAGQKNYLQTISAFCENDLTKQIAAQTGSTQGTWISDGAGPVAINFQLFLLNGNTITFYFTPSQVAADVNGSYQVVMPITPAAATK